MEGLVYHRLLAELRPILLGARLDKIHQVSDLEICLVLRNAGKNHRLILSASPSHPGFHLAGAAPGRTTGTPSGFCLLARRHLIPGTISALTQSGWERVIHLHCVSRDELGRRREPRLILELMGKHSNLILVEGETETILGALKLVPAEKSSVRQVLPGRRYVLPPAGERLDTVSVTRETLLGTLRRIVIDSFQREWPSILPACFTGIGQLGAREICWRAGVDQRKKTAETTPEEMERLADQLLAVRDDVLNGRTAPVLIRAGAAPVLITSGTAASGQGLPQDAWIQPLGHLPPERQEPCPDLVQATAFLQEQLRSCDDTLHKLQQLRRLINQSFRRARRLESALSMELEEGKRAEFYRRCGELVLANLNLIVPRTDKAALTDPGTGERTAIDLDPSLSPSANAQRYFQRYKKARRKEAEVGKRLEQASAEREYLESVGHAVELLAPDTGGYSSPDPEEVEAIAGELSEAGYPAAGSAAGPRHQKDGGRAKDRETQPGGPLRFTAPDGSEILAGRNNLQNEYLTFRLAAPRDTWLHTRNIPGSHVVIRNGGRPVEPETLELAAAVAAFYSKARLSSKVPVDYTEVRHVSRRRPARPGQVIYTDYRTIHVTPPEKMI